MKTVCTTLFLLFTICLTAQSLPLTFETSEIFVDFDGGIGDIIDNPYQNTANPSDRVARIVRDGGAIFAGSKIVLAAPLDFSTGAQLSMQVWTAAPVGTTIKFKLEGNGSTERDVQTTVSEVWETLTWDFTGEPAVFNEVVFMFDFGNVGDGSAASTFYFDNVQQFDAGAQMDLPVTFEDAGVNYALTAFEGAQATIVTDPLNPTNTVGQVTKPDGAGASSGVTIGTPAGFATDVPLTLTDSKLYAHVWTGEAGIPVRLKLEDSNDPTHTVETQTNSTETGWHFLEFDLANEAPGTAALSFGLDNGWTYNMASIFFNFGTDGTADGDTVYYFDNLSFGEPLVATRTLIDLPELSIFPNPTAGQWTLTTEVTPLTEVLLFDARGQLLRRVSGDAFSITLNASALPSGVYFIKITTARGRAVRRLVRD